MFGKKVPLLIIILPLAFLIFTGCNNGSMPVEAREELVRYTEGETAETGSRGEEEGFPMDEKPEPPPTREQCLTDTQLLEYKPNELGQVMILMYHQIGPDEDEWTRTPKNFRKDLETLYDNNYQLVSLLDYARGIMELDAGKSPVILTFDDASQGQFNYIETDDGQILDPECAVKILQDFCNDNPDFGKAASFYIYYPNPFGQNQYITEKLNFLVRNGYEIGNHTYSHANLSNLSSEQAIMEIALNAKETGEIISGYKVESLALPYGMYPQNRQILNNGCSQGFSYNNEAVLMVGSNPAPSPFSMEFNYLSLPRIRASETKVENTGLYDWLNFFIKYPEKRYTSDGLHHTITAPQEFEDILNEYSTAGRAVYFY